MVTLQLYPKYVSISPGTVRDLRDLRTDDLLHERDLLWWDRGRMVECDADANSIQIADETLAAMDREIAFRQRHSKANGAPAWPDTRAARYEALQQTARDLKVLWPIAEFASVVMAVQLRPTGKSHSGCCPLPDHQDSTPSFHVYPEDDRWHCFGCNRGGDIFDLTGLYFGIDGFRERVERVRDATPALIGGVA